MLDRLPSTRCSVHSRTLVPLASLALLAVAALSLAGCETGDPTNAVVDDAYPAAPDGGLTPSTLTVYRAWWQVTLFPEPVAAGSESTVERAVEGSAVAYAILAPGWDPASGTEPASLVPVETKTRVSAARGDTVHIVVDDAHVTGDCAAGQALTQAEADFITKSIFPGPFAGRTYDAATCTLGPATEADGSDAGAALDAELVADGSDVCAVPDGDRITD